MRTLQMIDCFGIRKQNFCIPDNRKHLIYPCSTVSVIPVIFRVDIFFQHISGYTCILLLFVKNRPSAALHFLRCDNIRFGFWHRYLCKRWPANSSRWILRKHRNAFPGLHTYCMSLLVGGIRRNILRLGSFQFRCIHRWLVLPRRFPVLHQVGIDHFLSQTHRIVSAHVDGEWLTSIFSYFIRIFTQINSFVLYRISRSVEHIGICLTDRIPAP